MAKNDDYEQEVTLPELKEILFKTASDELDAYIRIKDRVTKAEAESQRQRFISVYQPIQKAGLEQEFKGYRERVKREK